MFDHPWDHPENLRRGLENARDFLEQPQTAIIGGKKIYTSRYYYHHNPNTGEMFGPAQISEPRSYSEALRIASTPNPEWSKPENINHRLEVIDRFGQLISQPESRNTLFGLMMLSQGKNGLEALRDGQELIDFVKEYQRYPEILDHQIQYLRSDGNTTLVARPAGVVGVWAPFNFTCIGAGETVAALLTGNSVILHPSPRNVGPYHFVTEMLLQAGVPQDRLQFIVPDPFDFSHSKKLAADPRLDHISFTGSHQVGLEIDEIVARKRRRTGKLDYKVDIESGGRNPIIVTGVPEEGMDYMIKRLTDSLTGYQGQKCSALGEIIIVGDKLASEVIPAFIERLNKLKILPTTDPDSEMGSLIDRRAWETIHLQLKQIVADGGKILTGGKLNPGLPYALLPTLYRDLPLSSKMANAEIFGPVAQVRTVATVEEAIARANSMGYALTAAVMTETLAEARTIAAELVHGVTYVEKDGCTAAPVPEIPFGGAGNSGTGTFFKPGFAGHPLIFTRLRSVAQNPRNRW